MRKGLRDWQIRLVLILSATALFYAGLIIGRFLLSSMVIRMPENYEFLATRYAEKGDYKRALQACDREIARATYNFHAIRLKADLLKRDGRASESLRLLWGLPAHHLSIAYRPGVSSRGWDPARIHLRTAEALWALGRHAEALDDLQAAHDWRDPDVNAQCRSFIQGFRKSADLDERVWAFVGQAILDEQIRLDRLPEEELFGASNPPAGFFTRLCYIAVDRRQIQTARKLIAREVELHGNHLPSLMAQRQFLSQFPPERNWSGPAIVKRTYSLIERATVGRVMFGTAGTDSQIYQAKNFWAKIYRTGFVPGTMRVWDQAKGLCIVARGFPCFDVWPILVIRYNGEIVGRRYVRSSYHQVYTLPLNLAPVLAPIEVGFENDAYNEITKQDRNLLISEMRFF